MKLNSKMLDFVIIFLFVSFIPVNIVQAVNVGTVNSYPAAAPLIDGTLEADTWGLATAIDIMLYSTNDQNDNFTISMKSIYDQNGDFISFAFTIPDASVNDDIFGIIFKTNESAALVGKYPNWGFNTGNDLLVYYPYYDDFGDGVTAWHDLDGQFDYDIGGTNDTIEGADINSACCYTFELTTKIDSGDTIGGDISLAKKDSIEFFILYMEDTTGQLYSQIREADDQWDSCILYVGKPGLFGPSTAFIIASLVSSMLIFVSIKRKNK
jgi:hypothetical protein